MNRKFLPQLMMAIAIMLLAISCNKNGERSVQLQDSHPEKVTEDMMAEKGANPDETVITENQGDAGSTAISNDNDHRSSHYLYTESNETSGNKIISYEIRQNGSLDRNGSVASGGIGTGAPLGSQGAIVLSPDHEWLFAVNAGSNSVSSFKVQANGSLSLVSTENTHGKTPVSLSMHGHFLYVLNRGSDNIHGLLVGSDGKLKHIDGSTKPLSATAVDAPQISFTPGGEYVVVTEKATNVIGTFKINNNGSAGWGNFNISVGHTPFGFDFARNHFMIVSNAEMGGAGAGTGTSYFVWNNGKIKDINGARANYQSAPCWVATTVYGRFAYMTNTASNNISSYYVAPWGGLYLVESNAAQTGMGPLDIVVAANNYYVYVLNAASHSITSYHRKFFGQLAYMDVKGDMPAPATGLATF